VSSTVAAGRILKQSPALRAKVATGSVVNLVVSCGAAMVVPAVTDKTQSAAIASLEAAGFLLGAVSSEASSTVATGWRSDLSKPLAQAKSRARGSTLRQRAY
jgi:beta-lactam-binding protein with PASTA domain